jgi:hypothetical protein
VGGEKLVDVGLSSESSAIPSKIVANTSSKASTVAETWPRW